ncbi:HepT-like ribonuclease domain-containing protein [Thermophilibacter sp.]
MDERDVDIFVRMLLETDEIFSRMSEFGIDQETWRSSRALRDLLLMPLIQIGELATHLRDSGYPQRFPAVPWREIRGFRNVVVHGYGQIDIDIAWESATAGVAELRAALLGDEEVRAAYESELKAAESDSSRLSELIKSLPLDDGEGGDA